MPIKQVMGFKTEDEKFFNNKIDALNHDHRIALRGWVQSNAVERNTRTLTLDSLLDALQDEAKFNALIKLTSQHRQTINRHKGQIRKQNAVKINVVAV
jgi:hypothetical protein